MQASTNTRGTGFLIIVMLVGAALLLSGCGRPFVDSRREAGRAANVGVSNADRPVICYAKGETSPSEVLALAATVCADTGRVPRFDREDHLKCRLMQPWRAFFTCVSPGSAGANTAPPGGARGDDFLGGWIGPVLGDGDSGGGGPWRTPRLDTEGWEGGIYPDGTPPTPPRL